MQEEAESRFPSCALIAEATYPGGCNASETRVACYTLRVTTQVWTGETMLHPKMHWACLADAEAANITDDACRKRPWVFKYEAYGEAREQKDDRIYLGACSFPAPAKVSATAKDSALADDPNSTSTNATASPNATQLPNETHPMVKGSRSAADSARPHAALLAALAALRAGLGFCLLQL
uniref:Uncharacterized protein n=1 Tax=Alexandrium andersonii TaxID=327968 RepID=A0A7S2MSJ7_9DINO